MAYHNKFRIVTCALQESASAGAEDIVTEVNKVLAKLMASLQKGKFAFIFDNIYLGYTGYTAE